MFKSAVLVCHSALLMIVHPGLMPRCTVCLWVRTRTLFIASNPFMGIIILQYFIHDFGVFFHIILNCSCSYEYPELMLLGTVSIVTETTGIVLYLLVIII